MRRHHRAFRHRADAQRQLSTVRIDDVAPARFVEWFAVRREERPGLVDHRRRHRL